MQVMLLEVVARIRGGVNFRPEDRQRLMAMKEGGMCFSFISHRRVSAEDVYQARASLYQRL